MVAMNKDIKFVTQTDTTCVFCIGIGRVKLQNVFFLLSLTSKQPFISLSSFVCPYGF